MLKQRVITAFVVAGILLLAIFFFPYSYFAGLIALIVLVAAWEWSWLAGLTGFFRIAYVVTIGALIGLLLWWLDLLGTGHYFAADRVTGICALACLWWVSVVFWVAEYPQHKAWITKPVPALIGMLVLVSTWLGLVYLRGEANGDWLIVIMIVAVVCADTGAYFAGRKFGKRKLAPHVSPGKSWEGLYGGLVCSAVFAIAVVALVGFELNNLWLLAIVVSTSAVSVYGDLMESMLKRERGVKDSGTILPGHGGILDRADSITAAAPVFTLVYLLSGWRL